MAANVETMFSTRTKPWHGLGTIVAEAPDSKAALGYAGLDWNVIRREVFTEEGLRIPGYYANVRDSDFTTLGIVSERYHVVQNQEAFAFTDQFWEKVLPMKQQVLCREARSYGCWQRCRRNTL